MAALASQGYAGKAGTEAALRGTGGSGKREIYEGHI